MLSEGTILTIGSFVFWIDEVQVARLEQPALHGAEELMPRQSLEASAVFYAGNAIHQFVSVIEVDSILPVLDCESSGYESSCSHSSAAEVFMANLADLVGAHDLP